MTSAHSRTPKRFEEKVAHDLCEIGIPCVRVYRETHYDTFPDVIQVDGDLEFNPKPYWSLVQQRTTGPVIVECKTRQHSDIPAYVLDAIKAFEKKHSQYALRYIGKPVPSWLSEWMDQVKSYEVDRKPAIRFLAVRKKRGKGKGSGSVNFAVVDTMNFFLATGIRVFGIRWWNLSIFPYSHFLGILKDYATITERSNNA